MRVMQIKSAGTSPELVELPKPTIPGGELLIRTAAVGVGATEELAASGRRQQYKGGQLDTWFPLIPGFQSVGTIAEGADAGTLVAVNGVVSCGRCAPCTGGNDNHCSESYLQGIDPGRPGGFAEYFTVPQTHVHSLPPGAPRAAGIVASEMATALHLLNRVELRPTENIAIFGAGQTGILAVAASRLMGADEVIVVDPDPGRRDIALRMGASVALEPSSADAAGIRRIVPDGVDVALDVVGSSEVVEAAIRATGARGRVGLLGATEQVVLDLPDYADLVPAKEVAIHGSFGKRNDEFAKAIAFLLRYPTILETLPLQTIAVDDFAEAWQQGALRKGDARVIVEW